MRDGLRPKLGARALGAGLRKQGRRLRHDRLPADYWSVIGRQSRGVTMLTSLPGIWMTRIGARPAR
jgi:hypothetical protein